MVTNILEIRFIINIMHMGIPIHIIHVYIPRPLLYGAPQGHILHLIRLSIYSTASIYNNPIS